MTSEKPFLSEVSTAGHLLNSQPGRRVARVHLADPDIPGQHGRRLLPGLPQDVPLVHAVHCRLRTVAGSEVVRAQESRLRPGAARGDFQAPVGRVFVKSFRSQQGRLAMLRGSDRVADALQGLAHHEVAARCRRALPSGRLVDLGDRCQTAVDLGRGERARVQAQSEI